MATSEVRLEAGDAAELGYATVVEFEG